MKQFNVTVNGKVYEVMVEEAGVYSAPAPVAPPVAAAPAPKPAAAPAPAPKPAAAPQPAAAPIPAGAQTVTAPMPGKIMAVNVKPGDAVKRGDVLLILEAMKMQNEIMAPADAKVADVRVASGQTVATGDVMVVLG